MLKISKFGKNKGVYITFLGISRVLVYITSITYVGRSRVLKGCVSLLSKIRFILSKNGVFLFYLLNRKNYFKIYYFKII